MTSSSSAAPQADNFVSDVSLATFKADVVEASKDVLILISFWAAWEPSGAQMNAALEKIARGANGAFRLAKVEIDKNQAIVQQMGVQEIPAVYAVYKGRPVDAFSGSLSETQIKAWIDRLLKTLGLGGGAEKTDAANQLARAEEQLNAGDAEAAAGLFTAVLESAPDDAAASAGLARCALAKGNITAAREILDSASTSCAHRAFDSVRTALALAEEAATAKGQAKRLEKDIVDNPADHAARFDLALALWAEDRKDEAVEHLLEIVRRDRKWNDDGARKQLLRFFDALGPAHNLTQAGRKRLSSLLFS